MNESPSRRIVFRFSSLESLKKAVPAHALGTETARFVPIRKLEMAERMGLIAISNRGVSIRFWRLEASRSKLEESEDPEEKSAKNLRLGLRPGLCFLWVAGNSNSRFAIRFWRLETSGWKLEFEAFAADGWLRAGAAADSTVCVII
jgi:hypothetical protein